MSVYLSLKILTAVAPERAFESMMLLLQLCLDFTLHLTPSSSLRDSGCDSMIYQAQRIVAH